MPEGLKKIEWQQNRMHLSEVFIKLNLISDRPVEFYLDEDIVNHLHAKRDEAIEMHINFNGNKNGKVYAIDFSKLKRVKPVYPLLQQGITLPTIEKRGDQTEIAGTYAFFNKASTTWVGKDGWSSEREDFNIYPEKIVETFLKVTLTPEDVLESGAQWKIEESDWQESGGCLPVTTGAYQVELKEIPGWVCPKPVQIQVVDGIDENISVEYTFEEPEALSFKNRFVLMALLFMLFTAVGIYFINRPAPDGTVLAAISPPEIVQSGAKWRVDDGDWRESGTDVDLEPGDHLIEFMTVQGWECPEKRNVTVKEEQTTRIEGLYYKLVTVTINPEGAVTDGAKWKLSGQETWFDSGESVGLKGGLRPEVVFKEVQNWITPPKKSISYENSNLNAEYKRDETPALAVNNNSPQTAEPVNPSAGPVNPSVEAENPLVEAENPLVEAENPSVEAENPLVEAENPLVEAENPLVETENPTVEAENPPVEAVSLSVEAVNRSITIRIHPEEANWIGAKWKIKGPGNWKSSGETLSGLINIPYTVIFRNIEGWKKPDNIEIAENGTGNIAQDGTYEKIVKSRKEEIN